MSSRIVVGIGLLLALATGCNSVCDSAASTLKDKCGSQVTLATDDSCEADTEILSSCVQDNKDRTCAEIQAACFAQ